LYASLPITHLFTASGDSFGAYEETKMTQKSSYRESHKQKGDDYHRTFDEMPHRNMVWRLEQRVLTRIVNSRFGGVPPDHLDFASGTGRVLGHLSGLVKSSTAVDISESMLGVAARNVPGARIMAGDITREELLHGELFDLITAFRFFPNAEGDLRKEVIDELAARLGPDGVLVFNNHINRNSFLRRMSAIRRGTSSDRGLIDEEVRDLVESAGLRIVKRHPIAVAPLSENHMWFPRLTYWLERGLMKIPGVSGIARNVVYECKHKSQ
jgi:SAM-dependent methyltransferase